MTQQDKKNIDKYATLAERKGIYKFIESDGNWGGKYCLVVSAGDRMKDRIISILMLSDNLNKFGRDCVDVPISDSETMVARCGLVTYCRRDRLGEKVYTLSKHTMRRINRAIEIELGLVNRNEEIPTNGLDYKAMYKGLLNYIADNNIPVEGV